MSEHSRALLIEIGTEELPPTALNGLSQAFAKGISTGFAEREIATGSMEVFASPRRLAVLVQDVQNRQPDREILRRGPAITAAYGPDGRPTKAAEGFARSCGLTVEELEQESSDKGEWLVHRRILPGAETLTLIPEITQSALGGLPIPKRMRWGSGDAEFVRPIHWICAVLGDMAVGGLVLGIAVGRSTYGHRFHYPKPIVLSNAASYAEILRTIGHVEPSMERRREIISAQVEHIAESTGLIPELDADLLDEVAALVEWPQAILGNFDPSFLVVPPEVLIETMRKNQKYFPVRTADGALASKFIAVANIASKDPSQVQEGNERVIRPRFSDARFFWEQDLRNPLEENFVRLETQVFQERLGSIADKSRRVAELAVALAARIGANPEQVARAARLAKCDLVSSMVFEFPTLQGTMGRYYAERGGEEVGVSVALEEQYLPRFAGDLLPVSPTGQLLAIADRADSLVGIFGVGLRPTGARDPYGLRRASIAILRILIETPLDLDLLELLRLSSAGLSAAGLAEGTVDSVYGYMLDRLPGYYQEQGIHGDTVESVLAVGETNPWLLDLRVKAVEGFRLLPEAPSLAAANKRIRNILVKSEMVTEKIGAPDAQLFQDPSESDLWQEILATEQVLEPMLQQHDFSGSLRQLAGLRDGVDRFFDQVMILTEDDSLRHNRLALLARLHASFLNVADISKLQ